MERDNLVFEPSERLVERYNVLQDSLELPHGESRMNDIKRELSHVAFEIYRRVEDGELELEVLE